MRLAVIALMLLSSASIAAPLPTVFQGEGDWERYGVGDWTTYTVAVEGRTILIAKSTVKSRDDRTMILDRELKVFGDKGELEREWTISKKCAKPFKDDFGLVFPQMFGKDFKTTDRGRETITVGEKLYKTEWIKSTHSMTFVFGKSMHEEQRWYSRSVPMSGLVRMLDHMTVDGQTVKSTVELTDFGNITKPGSKPPE